MNLHLLHSRASRIWFVALVLAGGALAGIWMAAAVRRAHEPIHKGKRVGTWIAEMYANANDVTARDELVSMGTSAIPYLIREVRRNGNSLARRYPWLWLKMPSRIQRLLPAPPNYLERRSLAVGALEGFGPAASNAVPELIGCLQCAGYQPLRFGAAWALGSIGAPAKEAIPALMQALKDQDFNVRMEAAFALAKIGSGYSQATPQLISLLGDRVPGVRLRAALALWRLEPGETTASNRVARFLLEDPDALIRMWAASLIGELGPEAVVLSPALRHASRDTNSQVQINARISLDKLNAAVGTKQDKGKDQ